MKHTEAAAADAMSAVMHAVCPTNYTSPHHVFDVDESIITAALLKQGQCVTDQLAQAVVLLLAIVYAIAQVLVPAAVQQQMSVSQPSISLSTLATYGAAAATTQQGLILLISRLCLSRHPSASATAKASC